MTKLIDEMGNRYGRLLVVSRFCDVSRSKQVFWNCICSCGRHIVAQGKLLRRGAIKSCGCLKHDVWRRLTTQQGDWETIDETGRRYGLLTVIKRVEQSRYHGRIEWLCSCDCGGQRVVDGVRLRNGSVRNCGCDLIKPHCLPPGEANLNALFRRTQHGAKIRGLEFRISKAAFAQLTRQACHYCGRAPAQCINGKGNGAYIYNGLDRINNSLGYFLENVVPCCKTCNVAKATMTYTQFQNWVTAIFRHWGSIPLDLVKSAAANQPTPAPTVETMEQKGEPASVVHD